MHIDHHNILYNAECCTRCSQLHYCCWDSQTCDKCDYKTTVCCNVDPHISYTHEYISSSISARVQRAFLFCGWSAPDLQGITEGWLNLKWHIFSARKQGYYRSYRAITFSFSWQFDYQTIVFPILWLCHNITKFQ